jgi:hypothetical protein
MAMTFKVVDGEEPQSIQEQEAQIQQDFESNLNDDVITTDDEEVSDVVVEQDIDDARVLNYLKER